MSEPYYQHDSVTLHHGDCLDVLRADENGYDFGLGYGTRRLVPDNSVDSIVTDPPYGLGFMGKDWDTIKQAASRPPSADQTDARFNNAYPRTGKGPAATRFDGRAFQEWCELWATECLRVLKPGGHLLAFGGTRTWHRLAVAVEDAGFEIRDSIAWLYGSGFPKSLDVGKAIDKAAGVEREVAGEGVRFGAGSLRNKSRVDQGYRPVELNPSGGAASITHPATDLARQWDGWGTALKPAFEPVVVGRKPLVGTVAGNVQVFGTGALNINACRIEGTKPDTTRGASVNASSMAGPLGGQGRILDDGKGRWPANVILDEGQAATLDQQSGTLSHNPPAVWRGGTGSTDGWGSIGHADAGQIRSGFGDKGGASRFFYCAKAPKSERPSYIKDGAGSGRVTGLGGKVRQCNVCESRAIESGASEPSCGHGDFRWEEPTTNSTSRVAHATVKPLTLMRWLVRLVTPPGGTVFEPFAGSGTTVEACILEGFRVVAIEREAEYLPLIQARVERARKVVELAAATQADLLDIDFGSAS